MDAISNYASITFSLRKLVGYRFFRQILYWCKKQGNKFYQKGKCNSPIFSTLRLWHMLFLC